MTHRSLNGGLRGPAFVVAGIVAVSAAACSGGGSSGVPSQRATPTPPPGAQLSSAQVTIAWPHPATTSSSRRRNYVSNSTKSVTIVVNGGTPTDVDNPNLSPGTGSAFTQTTTVTVPAPVGPDTFLVSDYDATGGGGKLLAQASVPATVVLGKLNTIPITLDGNLAKIACMAVKPFVTGTNPFTLVGPAGQIAILPEDADSNIIIAPGAVPPITLAAANAAQATVTAVASTPNTYDLNIVAAAGVSVTLNATGSDLTGDTVAGACSVTRQEALYVANHGPGGSNPSISIYPASTTTSATPVATISGSKTELTNVEFVAVDPKGDIFVSNTGPQPGATFGPEAGFVSIYGPEGGSIGNQAPIALIPNINTPEGLAFDSKNDLLVLSIDRIATYPSNADGVTAAAAPSSEIAAPSPPPAAEPSPSASPIANQTDLFSCYGLATDASDNIYSACSNVLNMFPAGSKGNVAPAEIESVGTTAMSFASHSWLDIGVDSSGNMYAPASNNNLNFVEVFSKGSGANPAATPIPADQPVTGFSQPMGVFVDPNNAIFIGNYGSNTVSAYASLTTLEAGVAGASFTTGVTEPIGVYVR